jgi:hypothetical protein
MSTTVEEGKRGLRSVEEMARDSDESDLPKGMVEGGGDEETEDDGTDQLVLPGTGPKLNNSIGGKKPTESLFKMSSVSLPIAGGVQADKDTEMWIAFPVAIDKVEAHNRRRNREIVSVVRTHTAIAIGQPIILDGPPPGVE